MHWLSKAKEMCAAYWLSAARTRDLSERSFPMQQSHPKEGSDNLNPGMLAAGSSYPIDEGAPVLVEGVDGLPSVLAICRVSPRQTKPGLRDGFPIQSTKVVKMVFSKHNQTLSKSSVVLTETK